MISDRVSIIIPTYMDFTHIENTLISCCRQDYHDVEIIVRDDGSPNFNENDIEIILKKHSTHNQYKILHDILNRGTVANLNEAIKCSSGKYIVIVSGDDHLIDSNSVSSIVNVFKENQDCMCVTARERHILSDGREVTLPSPYEEFAIKHFSCRKLWYLISAHPCFILGSSTSYRRELFDIIGFFDSNYRLLEDWPFYLKMFEKGMHIRFLPSETIYHTSGGVSTPSKGFRNKLLVNDDLNCINYVISNIVHMKLSAWQKRTLYFRRELLSNELQQLDNCVTNKKYWIFMIVDWFWRKMKNISLRMDIRR